METAATSIRATAFVPMDFAVRPWACADPVYKPVLVEEVPFGVTIQERQLAELVVEEILVTTFARMETAALNTAGVEREQFTAPMVSAVATASSETACVRMECAAQSMAIVESTVVTVAAAEMDLLAMECVRGVVVARLLALVEILTVVWGHVEMAIEVTVFVPTENPAAPRLDTAEPHQITAMVVEPERRRSNVP